MKNLIENQLKLDDGTTLIASLDTRLDIRIERNGKPQYVLSVREYIKENITKLTEEEIAFLACFDAYMDAYYRIQNRGNKIIEELFGGHI